MFDSFPFIPFNNFIHMEDFPIPPISFDVFPNGHDSLCLLLLCVLCKSRSCIIEAALRAIESNAELVSKALNIQDISATQKPYHYYRMEFKQIWFPHYR